MRARSGIPLALIALLACSTKTTTDIFDTALPTCLARLTNQTDATLDVAEVFPTDFFGVVTSFDDVPVGVGETVEASVPVGEYELKAFNIENIWLFKSFGHVCTEGGTLEITAVQSDLQLGVMRVHNDSDTPLQSMMLASTDDLVWGTNMLTAPLEPDGQVQLSSSEGGFYWLGEDTSGSIFFGSTRVLGSEDGSAIANEHSLVQLGFCTMNLVNSTEAALRYIAIHDGVGWASNDAVLDSRGPLPVGEALDILVPTGSWSLVAVEVGDQGVQHQLSGLDCANEAPFSVTVP